MNVEFVRYCLMRAFLLPSSASGSKVETVVDLRDSSPYSKLPFRIEQLGDHSIRVLVEPVRAAEVQRYKGSRDPLLPTAFEDTAWIRAVRESGPVYCAWMRYCYSDDLDWDGQIAICNYVWGQFWSESLKLGIDPKPATEARLKSLIWLCVQNAKHRINQDRDQFIATELAELLHVHRSVFSRVFRAHWERMKGVCSELDYEALRHADRRYPGEQH